MNPLIRSIKSTASLGIKSSLFYAIYQLGLKSGHYKRVTPNELYVSIPEITANDVQWMSPLPGIQELKPILGVKEKDLKKEADEILNNQLRFFGGEATPFRFEKQNDIPLHWSDAEAFHNKKSSVDIKQIWEPARFNWVFPLARVYILFGKENYVEKFWDLFNEFTAANPFNAGLNWSSGQEVALRLMALIFGGSVFTASKSTTPQNLAFLLASIYLHAKRIPPTLVYARAQNNNHLIVEAVGLYCAGSFFKPLPIAQIWKELGWKLFNQAIQNQIFENGEYTQHSLNYHRLMLQASLWMKQTVQSNHESLPKQTLTKLQMATNWLLNYVEPTNGQVPNLGHNDGSNIFPLTQCEHRDYRPVAQAASVAFLGRAAFPKGCWNEEIAWLGIKIPVNNRKIDDIPHTNAVPWIGNSELRVYLQAIQYKSRPAHADQLHADIWYKGFNIAMDAGTYSYNLPAPWQNTLAGTSVHNTISIDGLNQMTAAGKFRWLDWANATIREFDPENNLIRAFQDGYRHLGILHERKIKLSEKLRKIEIDDHLDTNRKFDGYHIACINWLLPDWPWKLDQNILALLAPFGRILISISNTENIRPTIDLVRAGKSLLLKKTENPNLGWYSPTYLNKIPALSLRYAINFNSNIQITTVWQIVDN
jgi:hypothetical protein